ncbi:MAG: ABC transporter substrate-binding protein [Synergistales bacterium]|nr:ABC transporter substrate-binding protein [Synergistales bacterium]
MRIVSLLPSATELVYALGIEGDLAAVSRFCDWPLQCRSLPAVGDMLHVDTEAIRRIRPDIVLYSPFFHDRWLPPKDWGGTVRIPCDCHSVADILQLVAALGESAHCADRAARLQHWIKEQRRTIQTKAEGIQRRPRVLRVLDCVDDPEEPSLIVAGPRSLQGRCIQEAGGEVPFGEREEHYFRTPFSEVSRRVVDALLLCTYRSEGGTMETAAERCLENHGFGRSGRLLRLPCALVCRNSHRVVYLLAALCGLFGGAPVAVVPWDRDRGRSEGSGMEWRCSR